MKKYLIGVLALSLTSAAFAQKKVDIAGSWTLDAEKSGKTEGPPAVVIAVTATDVSVQFGSSPQAMTFKVDGTETTGKNGTKTKAEWKADAFLATVTTPRGPDTVKFSRDGAWLVMEGQSREHPMKFYFKKSAAK